MAVVDRTDLALTIFKPGYGSRGLSHREKDEVEVAKVTSGGTSYLPGPCDLQELIARDRRGDEVARHEPTGACDPDLPAWAIS
jgi:hypothetical protein